MSVEILAQRSAKRPRKNRDRIDIVADILEIAKDGSRKTRIMYLGNLSFDLLGKYVDMLVDLGLLEATGGGWKFYSTTEKGRRFLEEYHEVRRYSQITETKLLALESYLTRA